MDRLIEYALLADLAYRDLRNSEANNPVIPAGWVPVLGLLPNADADRPGHYGGPAPGNPSGFSADVFRNGNEIVISYCGTNPDPGSTDGLADWGTNLTLIGGMVLSAQLIQSAQLYIAVRRANPSAQITLTGHSLGGGLASLVGVMFDVTAHVFAQAPFESTVNYDRLAELNTILLAWGATAAELVNLNFLKDQLPQSDQSPTPVVNPTASAEFVRRERNIRSYYIPGEAVGWVRGPSTAVMNPIERSYAVGRDGMSGTDLHSMQLHAAIFASNNFQETSLQLPTLLSLVLDKSLYARALAGDEKDFLQRLMEFQFGTRTADGTPLIQANGMLDRFAVDVSQVARSNLMAQSALREALIVAGIEYYNKAAQIEATPFFESVSGGLRVDLSRIGTALTGLNSIPRMETFVKTYLAAIGEVFEVTSIGKDAWYVQGGQSPLSVTSLGSTNDLMLGWTGVDRLDGGAGDDLLIDAAGSDHLTGGMGDDILIGGMGDDIYYFSVGDGNDKIVEQREANGEILGRIAIGGGAPMAIGAFFKSGNEWKSADGSIRLTHNSPWTLVLADGSTLDLGEDLIDGDFGIDLQERLANPVTTETLLLDGLGGAPATVGNSGWWGRDIQLSGADSFATVDFITPAVEAEPLTRYGYFSIIHAGAGNDIVELFNDADVAYGEAGHDVLVGGPGYGILTPQGEPHPWNGLSILDGGTGNDQLFANGRKDLSTYINLTRSGEGSTQFRDWLRGGAGDDELFGDSGRDVLSGGAGTDLLIGALGDDLLYGDADWGTNVFGWNFRVSQQGDSFGVVLSSTTTDSLGDEPAGGAADYIYAGAGADHVIAGVGDDVVYGDAGADVVFGDAGSDTLFGGNDNDRLIGDDASLAATMHGADYLDGGAGDDILQGQGGDDFLIGGTGNDRLYGDLATIAGADYLDGGAGDDMLSGGGSADTLTGGAGNDQLFGDADDVAVALHGDDALDGEAGNDYLRGYGGSDYLAGGEGFDQLHGDAGDDTLDGGDGDDDLYGGDGDDILIGGLGIDTMRGGAGNDTYLDVEFGDIIEDQEGKNEIRFAESVSAQDLRATDIAVNGQSAIAISAPGLASGGGVAKALILVSGAAGMSSAKFVFKDGEVLSAEQLYTLAYSSPVSVNGTDGDDTLMGFGGDDTLTGWDGDDVLIGGRGNDNLRGLNGADTYIYRRGDGNDYIADTGDTASIDAIQFAPDIAVSEVTLERQANGDLLLRLADGGSITIAAYYHGDDYRIEEIRFGDVLAYTASDFDALTVTAVVGTEGADALNGTYYDDVIQGGGGDDVIDGKAGDDRLEGGAGRDTYLFGYGGAWDTYLYLDGFGGGRDILIDASSEGSVVQLQGPLGIDNLGGARLGNDLILSINGVAADALVLKDYYAVAQDWIVRDIAGMQVSVEAIVQATMARSSNLVQQRWDAAIGVIENEMVGAIRLAGPLQWSVDGGLFRPWPASADNVHATVAQTTYTTIGQAFGEVTTQENRFTLWPFNLHEVKAQFSNRTLMISDEALHVVSNSQRGITSGVFFVNAEVVWDQTLHVESHSRSVVKYLAQALPVTVTTDHITGHYAGRVSGFNVLGPGSFTYNEYLDTAYFPTPIFATLAHYAIQDSLTEVFGDASNNQVIGDHRTLIDAGAGHDTVRGGQMAVGGEGNDYLINGMQMSGGNGIDRIVGRAFFDGPTGWYVDGSEQGYFVFDQYAGNVVLINPEDTGIDLVSDVGDDGLFWNQYNFFYPPPGSGDDGVILFGLGVGVTPVAAPDFASNDFATLEQFYGDGIIVPDVVYLPEGVTLANARLRLGTIEAPLDLDYGVSASSTYQTLDITWGPNKGIRVLIPHADDQIGSGIEHFQFADGTLKTIRQMLELVPTGPVLIEGTDAADTLIAPAGQGADLQGFAGGDTLIGDSGDDFLDGGAGNDSLAGGTGNDTYRFGRGDGHDLIAGASPGVDTLQFDADVLPADVSLYRHGDDLVATIAGDPAQLWISGYYAQPDAPIETIAFSEGTVWDAASISSRVIAGAQNAALGTAGNDMYVVDHVGDTITEGVNQGIDTVRSWVSYTLPDNVENIVLTGVLDIDATGNRLANTLDGLQNTGSNVLSGGVGDDTYILGVGDRLIENAGEGADTVQSTSSFDLASVANVENIVLTGATATSATGNAVANRLDGAQNGATNTLIGGAGDDVYVAGSNDIIIENAGEGTDLVQAIGDYTLAANLEALTLLGSAINGTGNAEANLITGNAQDNVLDGGAGTDTLRGRAGNDTYIADSAGDVVIEGANEGMDTIHATVTYSLGEHQENLVLTGTNTIDGNGNGLDNTLTGNSAPNSLNGGAGADTMAGGAGGDVYIVDNTGDVVIEAANDGTDTIITTVSYTLGDHQEHLLLTGTNAINGTGNGLDNTLSGNSAANTLSGGAGNDTYIVSNSDTVIESAAGGTDTVIAGVNWALAANLENLTLSGSGDTSATGNSLDNLLTGNTGHNTLDGGAGADQMAGGAGNDLYLVENTGDAITEQANDGIDSVQSTVSYALSDQVDYLRLTGAAAINGTGNALANVLIGNAAANQLSGGAGDDIYIIDTSDTVIESSNAGIDLVQIASTYTLGENFEALRLTGINNLNGNGNALNNLIIATAGNNTLTGGAGANGNDILQGMAGNDIIIDTAGANLFDGGAGNDLLTGGAGNALFAGGLGNDVISLGSGADIIVFNRNDGADTVSADEGLDDAVSVGGGISYADMRFAKSGNDLILKLGGADQIRFNRWYAGSTNKTVLTLQVVAEAIPGFNPTSNDPLLNDKVTQFDFRDLASAFDQARSQNPGLTEWALTNAITSFQLAGSDTEALGGNLATWYGNNGSFTSLGYQPVQDILGAANFGAGQQALQPAANLQIGGARMS